MEEKARAYIEKYNREHGDLANPLYLPTCLLVWFGFSVAAPFWPMVFEALGIITILFLWVILFCVGPTLWTVMRSLGCIGWVTSLFHDNRYQPSPDPASPSEALKLVPSHYYAHLSKQREEREKAALLLPEQRLFPFEEAATSLVSPSPGIETSGEN